MSGALKASGDYQVVYPLRDKRLNTCDRIASGGHPYLVPTPTNSGATTLQWEAAIVRFVGPGTYSLPDFTTLRVDVVRAPRGRTVRYTEATDTEATLTVDRHDAGTLTFTGLRSAGGATLAGKLSWTCKG